MAIIRVPYGTTPNPVSGDWALNAQTVVNSYQNISNPLQVVGSSVPQGATFQIGGVIYKAETDTAITGTLSDYVKLTPNAGDGGATCDASFVPSLSGVTWNKVWNWYYDTGGNAYIFNEPLALLSGAISVANTWLGQMWKESLGQALKPTSDVQHKNMTVDSLTSSGAISGATVNTGHGSNELYAMDQPVRTTDETKFTSVVLSKALVIGGSGTHYKNEIFSVFASYLEHGDECLLSGRINQDNAYYASRNGSVVTVHAAGQYGSYVSYTFSSTEHTVFPYNYKIAMGIKY